MINASGNTLIIDIRDELSFEYGHIDGAVNIPAEKLDKSDLPKDKKLLICCKSGLISDTEAEKLRELGYDAENLEGGYYGWLREKLSKEVVEDISQDAERSIQKKFRKEIWNRFTQSVNEYELIKPNYKEAKCGEQAARIQPHGKAHTNASPPQQVPFRGKISCYGSGLQPCKP